MTNLYRAIGKSMAARYAVYAFNMLSLMVLMRLFIPEIVGIVAAAQTIVTLFQLIAEGGLSPAIISLDHLECTDRNGIFGFSLFVGVVVSITMLALGPALASFYGMEKISQITPYIAIALLANTAAVMPLAQLQRQQAFTRIAQAGILAELGALTVTLIAYFMLPALHAYSLYFPIKASLYFIANWKFSRETEFGQPSPGTKFSAIAPLMKITGHQLGSNFVNYFSRNLDNILVGKFIGAASLGIYDRAYQLMRYPLLLLTFAMTPAIQPALKGTIKDINSVNILHRDLAHKLSIVGSGVAAGVFFFAKTIVLVAFGAKWLQVVPIIQLMSLIIPVQVIFATNGSFFLALNKTNLMLWSNLLIAGSNVVAIIWGIYNRNIQTLCWSLFFSFHISFFLVYYIMHKFALGGGYLKFLASIWPIVVTTVVLALIASTRHLPN